MHPLLKMLMRIDFHLLHVFYGISCNFRARVCVPILPPPPPRPLREHAPAPLSDVRRMQNLTFRNVSSSFFPVFLCFRDAINSSLKLGAQLHHYVVFTLLLHNLATRAILHPNVTFILFLLSLCFCLTFKAYHRLPPLTILEIHRRY